LARSLNIANPGELANELEAAVVIRRLTRRDLTLDTGLRNVSWTAQRRRDASLVMVMAAVGVRRHRHPGEQQPD
jgi:hypothetical protein